MTQGHLINPDGTQMTAGPESFKHEIDLRQHHACYRRGDILVWLTWRRTTGEACIVLTPRYQKISHKRIIPCVIPLSRAWAWAEETGDMYSCMHTAGVFLANMGRNPFDRKAVYKLIRVVQDHLHDLIVTPPMPKGEQVVRGEIEVTDHATGRTVEKEIYDDA